MTPDTAAVVRWPAGARRLVAHRYELLGAMGRGGTSDVYRALDRLTGGIVVLKKLRFFGHADDASERSGDRFELIKEFEILTTLRHPNIISVLEFGFDDDATPFFTMELEENPRSIVEAGADLAESLQIDLLVQVLRALVYLHDSGVLHRDLSPSNVAVVDRQLKVLDFGFAAPRHVDAPLATVGTLRYMAPELFEGAKSTVESDLFSFGMIALELLNGGYPFPKCDKYHLYRQLAEVELPRPTDLVRSRMRPVVARLLQRDPLRRFHSASEVIAALGEALGDPIPLDTMATRESFLQAAPFVGRIAEIAALEGARREAIEGKGGAWLVAGESGVGKTRLLAELRRRALVDGMLVARGDAVREGGPPYHVWRKPVRELLLSAELSSATASVLKTLVPDIAELLGREVPDPPRVDPETAQSRLFLAIEELLGLQRQPVLVLLEDLHWVGSESLALMSRLADSIREGCVFLIGTFRNDDAPNLHAEVPRAELLALRRMNFSEMAALGEAMIGPAARQPSVIDLLQRESEGIPFFLVEVVRELADRSGSRLGIGDGELPDRVVTGGIQRSIRRRLERVDARAMDILQSAAVMGRDIDPPLLRALHPEVDFEAWVASCNRAAVIDIEERRWRFSHDKVREQLLDDLVPQAKCDLHGRVAAILESNPDRLTILAPRLAHHWSAAGDRHKESYYCEVSGRLALESGACREALRYLGRAREIVGDLCASENQAASRRRSLRRRLDPNRGVSTDTVLFRLGRIEGDLSEAHYRLGDLSACRRHAEGSLRYMGQYVPDGELDWRLAVLRQWLLRLAQTVLRVRSARDEETALVASAVAKVQSKITDASFYSLSTVPLLWSSIRLINQCEPVGASSELARGYIILALLAGMLGAAALEKRFARRAREVADEVGSDQDLAWVLSRTCVLYQNDCNWLEFDRIMPRAIELAEKVGDVKLLEECRAQTGAVDMYRGEYRRALDNFADLVAMASRSGNRQLVCWVSLGRADCLCWMGRPDEAEPIYQEVLRNLDEEGLKTEAIWAWGSYARALLRLGDYGAAFDGATRALHLMKSSAPLGYWMKPGYAGTADVFLRLWESQWSPPAEAPDIREQAGDACRALAAFARRFPLGRPSHLLCAGLRRWLEGRGRSAARAWNRAVAQASALNTPYELAVAHSELARHLDESAARWHEAEARRIFQGLGCEWQLADAAAAREGGR